MLNCCTLVSVCDLLLPSFFSLPAIKNNSDNKFSYQQLPVSLRLIYTILQV